MLHPEIPLTFPMYPERFLMNGGTCAFAPNGNEILAPLEPDVDFHVLSLNDSNKYLGEKMNLSRQNEQIVPLPSKF